MLKYDARHEAEVKKLAHAPKKRKYVNNGRPPDTAAKLTQEGKRASKRTEKDFQDSPSEQSDAGVTHSDEERPKKRQRQLKTPEEHLTVSTVSRPGYPWHNNSCWLDTSLQTLYVILVQSTGLQLFLSQLERLPESAHMWRLHTAISSRSNLPSNFTNKQISTALRGHRNDLCRYLSDHQFIVNMSHFEPFDVRLSFLYF